MTLCTLSAGVDAVFRTLQAAVSLEDANTRNDVREPRTTSAVATRLSGLSYSRVQCSVRNKAAAAAMRTLRLCAGVGEVFLGSSQRFAFAPFLCRPSHSSNPGRRRRRQGTDDRRASCVASLCVQAALHQRRESRAAAYVPSGIREPPPLPRPTAPDMAPCFRRYAGALATIMSSTADVQEDTRLLVRGAAPEAVAVRPPLRTHPRKGWDGSLTAVSLAAAAPRRLSRSRTSSAEPSGNPSGREVRQQASPPSAPPRRTVASAACASTEPHCPNPENTTARPMAEWTRVPEHERAFVRSALEKAIVEDPSERVALQVP